MVNNNKTILRQHSLKVVKVFYIENDFQLTRIDELDFINFYWLLLVSQNGITNQITKRWHSS